MDIFKFEISDKLRVYKSNSLNLEVKLKTNNFKVYLKEMKEIIVSLEKSQNEIFRILALFMKGKNYVKPEIASVEKNQLMISLNQLQKDFLKAHPENKKFITENCPKILEDIILAISEQKYDQIQERLHHFFEEINSINQRKTDMCEKLKLLEDKALKAICFFEDGGFKTHFTKYYLNLEHFADTLHAILSLEIENCLVKNYQVLEKTHFDLLAKYHSTSETSLNILSEINDEIFENYRKIEEFNYIFLKAQIRYEQMKNQIEDLVQDQMLIAKKFKEIYSEMDKLFIKKDLHSKYNIKTMFLFSLNLFYNMSHSEFSAFPAESLPQIFLNAARIKKSEVRKNILFSNLELIEPELVDKIKRHLIKEFQNKEQYETLDYQGSYLIRKAKKNIFDNNQFYSHELTVFAFLPDEVSSTSNRFMRSSGYDKVSINKHNVRYKMEVFSSLAGLNLNCDLFLNIQNYQINQQSLTLKRIA